MCRYTATACFLFLFLSANSREVVRTTGGFQENKGQLVDQKQDPRPDILFYGNAEGLSYFLKKDGISYQLYKSHTSKSGSLFQEVNVNTSDSISIQRIDIKWLGVNINATTIYRVDISWMGANKNARITMGDALPGVEHFYTGAKPATNVKSYAAITYTNIYPSIDLKYYSKEGSLKYDYIVKPYADYHNIKLKIEGATAITKNKNGSLTIQTPLGDIQEGAPLVYQEGEKLTAEWTVNDNVLSFHVDSYDKTKTLVIDPLVFQWLVFEDDGIDNYYFKVNGVTDPTGNLYWCGTGGNNIGQGFLDKVNTNGVAQSSILFGSGSSISSTNDCITDASGNIYAVGATSSSTNIATTGAYQTTNAQGYDGYITKVDPTGTVLWTSYYGKTGNDYLVSCSVDGNGNIYASGSTSSPTNIASPGSHQPAFGGGNSDGFIVKFSPSGTMAWASYYGGTGDDYGTGCATDNNGFVYICGTTTSQTAIASPASYQATFQGTTNGFLVKFDGAGVRQWATYFGSDSTSAEKCRTDNFGHIYFCGGTDAVAGIATSGTYQPAAPGGPHDGYLTKFNASGVKIWGTYLGGAGFDWGWGCAVNSAGKVYLAGNTHSTTNIATPGAYQTVLGVPFTTAAFLVEFDTAGQRLWGTYYITNTSSLPYTIGNNCYADNSGNVYLLGRRKVGTTGTHNYAIKFSPNTIPVAVITASSLNICQGSTVLLSTSPVTGASYAWFRNGIPIAGAATNSYNASLAGSYTVTVTVNSTPNTSQPVVLTISNVPVTSVSSTNITCNGAADGSISLTASGATAPYTYTWNSLSATSPTVTNLSPGTYISTTKDANNCQKKDTVVITQPAALSVQKNVTNVPCSGAPIGAIAATVSGGTLPYTYSWNNPPVTSSVINNLPPGIYILTTIDSHNCVLNDTTTVITDPIPMPSQPLVSICAVTVDSATGKNLIIWEKTGLRHAAFYKVYRETSVAGQYALVDSNTSAQFSTMIDTASNPLQQSYSYKITEVDSCSNEVPMSTYHKTIHLSANTGINGEINLSWNQYEGKTYSTHYIMRSLNSATFVQIAQVSSGTLSYSDLTPPVGQKTYRIDIDLPTSCSPTAKVTSYSRISSNNVSLGVNGVTDPWNSAVSIIPNPTTGAIRVIGSMPAVVKVIDAVGKVILEVQNTSELTLAGFAKGLYIIKLFDIQGNLYHTAKIIKE